jgi:DNA processing protein
MTLDSLAGEMREGDQIPPASGLGDGALVLERGDPGYPSRLALLPDPPSRLYARGQIPTAPMVAIVGSREADSWARRLASALAAELAAQGLVVISGGARGIDTAAHQGALDGGGSTVAVIGSGFGHLYPEGNRPLFERIAARGAVLSEFEADTPPARWTFPRRNRLVAALSSAVVVAQAADRSGALITARIARELGLPVGAVPGAAGDPRSRGCNQLIRTGAAVVEGLADVLALLALEGGPRQLDLPELAARGKDAALDVADELSEPERAVLDRVGPAPLHIDEIAADAGLSASEALAALLSLELAGLVEDRGGKRYVRLG